MTTGAPVVCLIHLLSREAHLYGLLADHAKMAIQHAAESDASARCLAWFTSANLQEHATKLGEWIVGADYPQIDRATWDSISEISDSAEWSKQVIRLSNKYYIASRSYNAADRRFSEVIHPQLARYDLDDCIDPIEGIQGNSQTGERGRAQTDHREVRARALELDPTFNLAQHAIFNFRVNLTNQCKRPARGRLHWLVEPAGIEPASASPLQTVLHT